MAATYTQTEKMFCDKNHPLFGDNLYITPKGKRNCKACRRQANRNWRRRAAYAKWNNLTSPTECTKLTNKSSTKG